MKINGWNISAAGGKQWAVKHNAGYTIKNNSSWEAGAAAPLLLDGYVGNKKKVITIKVTGASREAALINCSTIAGKCIGVVDIEFDNYSKKFKGNVTGITHSEFDSKKKSHRLEITVEGYEYGTAVSTSNNNKTSFSINCAGTMNTPAILELTSSQNIVTTVTITGFGNSSILLKKVLSGDKIIINGETGIVTKNGSPNSDVEVWALPVLKPGSNSITIGSSAFTFKVTHSPRYM